jgi:outer membrane lipoprotein-sorting protein
MAAGGVEPDPVTGAAQRRSDPREVHAGPGRPGGLREGDHADYEGHRRDSGRQRLDGTAQVYAAAPERYRLTLNIPEYGGVIETVLDGENGWQKNPDSGVHAMSRTDLAIARRDYQFYREIRLKELFPKMEAAPEAKVNGRPVNVIAATPASGPPEKLYFDAETGLLVKRDFERVTLEDGIVQYEVFYRDYRDVDGVKLPSVIEQHSPDSTTIFKFSEIKNNAAIEDGAFAKPAK